MLPGVLFDSNVYRSLDEARFGALLELERRRDVARYAEPLIVSEFLAHLADPQDKAFGSCRKAVGRVYRRCGPAAGGTSGIIRDSESRLHEFITGRVLTKHDDYTKQVIAPLFADIALTPADQPLTRMETHLRMIADHMADVEKRFASTQGTARDTVDSVLESIDDAEERRRTRRNAMRTLVATDVHRTKIAEGMIRNAFQVAGPAVPEPVPPAWITRVLRGAAAWIEFEMQLHEKTIFQPADLEASRIRNLRWDQRIAFNIGQTIGKRPLWLVTDDRAFANVAQVVGHSDCVHTLAAYEAWLQAEP